MVVHMSRDIMLRGSDGGPYEPRHDKTNKVTVLQAKTQTSLGISPV